MNMKNYNRNFFAVALSILVLLFISATQSVALAEDAPPCTKSKSWTFIVNNAFRTADEYAMKRNPAAAFATVGTPAELIKQEGGEYKGKYLLKILVEAGKDTNFAMLLPLFDVNSSVDSLDDEKPQWKVIQAKHNGKSF